MIDERRYILVEFSKVTQEIIDNCIQSSFETLRHVKFENDDTDWVVLKYSSEKPEGLWDEFPVMSDQEMLEILLNDLNAQIE